MSIFTTNDDNLGANILCHAAHWAYTPEHCEVLNLLYFKGKARLRQCNVDVLNGAASRSTKKGEINFGAEWLLDTVPQWNVNTRCLGVFFPLLTILCLSNNLPLVRRLVEQHDADLTLTATPCKFDLLMVAVNGTMNVFVEEVAEYMYHKTRRIRAESWSVNERGKMPAANYYLLRGLRYVIPLPRHVTTWLLESYLTTLLHTAVMEVNLSGCLWLLKKRADATIKNHTGDTPLSIAEKRGYLCISKLLQEKA